MLKKKAGTVPVCCFSCLGAGAPAPGAWRAPPACSYVVAGLRRPICCLVTIARASQTDGALARGIVSLLALALRPAASVVAACSCCWLPPPPSCPTGALLLLRVRPAAIA